MRRGRLPFWRWRVHERRVGILLSIIMNGTTQHPLHRYKGDTPTKIDRLSVWVVMGICVIALAILLFVPKLAGMAQGVLSIFQLLVLVAIVVAAMTGVVVQRHKRSAAERALREVAAGDAFWAPEVLRAQVESLFEPYWRAVVAGDVRQIAERLTGYWQGRLEQSFAEWRNGQCRAVMFDLALKEISVVGFEDWRNNQRDQVTVRVDARTSYHVTHLLSGSVVEGVALSRDEAQLWQLVRGDAGWLLNRVELVAGPMAYRDCRIIREEGA